MKRYIRSSESKKFFNYRLSEEEQEDRLNIPAKEVAPRLLENVLSQDKEIMKYLIDRKIFPTIITSSDLRNNPYYELEDKLIRFVDGSNVYRYRTYAIPYAGSGRFGTGDIYESRIDINDEGQIRFDDKWIDPQKYATSTLKKYFFQRR